MATLLRHRLIPFLSLLLLLALAPVGARAATPNTATECIDLGLVWVHVEIRGEVADSGCAVDFGTGEEALVSAGVEITDNAGFITHLAGRPDASDAAGSMYWWSYWTLAPQDGSPGEWAFSEFGMADSRPQAGSVEAWVFQESYAEDAVPPALDPLAATGPGPIGPGADPATPAERATAWLLGETTDGALPNFLGNPDWGLTTDAVLGLVAAGAGEEQLAPVLEAVQGAVRDGSYGFLVDGENTYVDAGGVAKLTLIASLTGADPSSYGGRDLVSALESELVDGQLKGANTFGQAYAVMALAGLDRPVTEAADFLVAQQCPSGDFRLFPAATPCTTDAGNADRDASALAVLGLRAAAASGLEVAAALDSGVEWLVSDQKADGSWIGSRWTASPNTNSTGLVAHALSGLATDSVRKAAAWTASLQVSGGADDGAVAYDAAAFGDGAITGSRSQWQRATSQALFALAPQQAPEPDQSETPSPAPTVTVTATATATATATVTSTAPATGGRDLYETPGFHTSGGRNWMTVCEPYSLTTRCWTYIWGTTVHEASGVFVPVNGWQFNNLTYVASPRSSWADNPLGHSGRWTAEDGRQWRTECDTAVTGKNGCRSYVQARVVQRTGDAYHYETLEVFNNMVRFSR
ncbi:prenyltransferase/squalene oxidase repeat-containing protein [Tessaracoccus rhinocerotis]|uniref:prenyltransferase/squalene oxidase repeat-containing protein n=1 Tax=Tessaracoccus rhinocerotis TaxID=1689449 RepID=UPI00163D8760|nr:prenyltransferase/squalene oxidase repeat-containing protein [Tessaracoccus rhinocerotis]